MQPICFLFGNFKNGEQHKGTYLQWKCNFPATPGFPASKRFFENHPTEQWKLKKLKKNVPGASGRADSCPLSFSNSTLSCVPVENVLMIVKNALNILQVRELKEWLSNYHFLLVTSDIFNPFPSNFAGKVQVV